MSSLPSQPTAGGSAQAALSHPAALPAYAELCTRSNFSFLHGASHPEELITRAQSLGYAALAVTDECSLGGIVRAHEAASKAGFRLVVGVQMRLSRPGPARAAGTSNSGNGNVGSNGNGNSNSGGSTSSAAPAGHGARLVLLAQSRRGYGNLVRWVTVARRRAPKGQYEALAADVEGKTPAAPMIAGLPDCMALLVPQAEPGAEQGLFETLFAQAMWLKTWFGVERGRLALSQGLLPSDAVVREAVVQVSALTGLAIVAVGDALMHRRSRKPLLDVLTATRLKRTVAECGHALQANGEAHLRSRARLAQLFRPEWLQATLEVAAQCAFSMDQLRYEYPQEVVPDGHTPTSWLRELTEEGVRQRYPQGLPPAVRGMVEHELAVIAQLQVEAYFLTVADIVQWARGRGILCQGRGSAANSAVCYCLGVTAVDPAFTTLLFERFISPERNEPPDIDIDFEHQRREEVIQYLYRKYGRHRAALTGVTISYRPRSALRDVGRALGIDADRIDAVAKNAQWWRPGGTSPSSGAHPAAGSAPGAAQAGARRSINTDVLSENGFDPDTPLCRLWMELTAQLIGFPRHLSQHPGGFVIARDDLAHLVPVENAAMDGRSVIQWDKDDLDALRLIKVDILALGMLSGIRRALTLVGNKGVNGGSLALHEIPREDPGVYDMLCRGDSVGTFQVESRAQMSMLPRLKPRCFYDLVIEVAIVRPGPIQGGMVHPYLRRRNGEEPVDYPSDEVRQALERTLGVPIFQEQVMQLAILAADFSPGEADQLRRAMAAWKRKGGLGPFHERLVGRMVEKGYTPEYAERIFAQIQGFGEYGFPESHAASFALLVYASAWLKRWHPDAFLAALLNSQPMGFYAPAQLVRDAQMHGVQVLPVDIVLSQWESTLEANANAGPVVLPLQPAALPPLDAATPIPPGLLPVRLGFSRISGLSQAAAERIVSAREQQVFTNVEDLARRAQLDAHALQLLAGADALETLTGHRRQAAWAVAGVDTRPTPLLRQTRTAEITVTLPAGHAAGETLADYRATGLSLKNHPLALLRPQLDAFKIQTAQKLRQCRPGQLARASGIVTHRQRPGTAKGVVFVTLEDETGHVNVIVWPAVVEAQRRPLLASRLLTVYGVWQREGEVMHLVARKLVDHTPLLQGLATRSRDFH